MVATEKEIGLFYEKYKCFVFYIAIRRTGNEHDTHDIMQVVFLKTIQNFKKLASLDEEGQKAYLSTMTTNAINDMYKNNYFHSKYEHTEDVELPATIEDGTYEIVQKKESASQIWRFVEQLESRNALHGKCLALRYYLGFSDIEIADMLHISHSNCRMIMHRARKKLKEILSEDNRKGVIYPGYDKNSK